MRAITLSAIARAVGGKLPEGLDPEQRITEISTDTRSLSKGCVFLALRGETFDGHDFVMKAIENGAICAITDIAIEGCPCICVKETGQALLNVAEYYRSLFSIPLIGITGSVGKTTTKELVACVLGEKYTTLKTAQNLNNEIGMPKTLLQLEEEHGAAVIEMGMSHFGEISRMAVSCHPTIGVITNIGFSHVENLGSQEGILRAKRELLDGMAEHAPLVVSADDAYLCSLKEQESTLGRPVYTYSAEGNLADVSATHIKEENAVTTFTICQGEQNYLAVLPAVGIHNVKNALAAFLVGQLAGLEVQEILCGLARYVPAGMRQKILEKEGRTVIVDCYNASPDSMRAALSVLKNYPCEGKRIAVLGDMLELGEMSMSLHEMVGEYVAQANLDFLFCYGKASMEIARRASELVGGLRTYYTESKKSLEEMLAVTCEAGDCILFKGSRGMHLETVIDSLYGLS